MLEDESHESVVTTDSWRKERLTDQPWLEVQHKDRDLDRGQCGWELYFDAHTHDVMVSYCRRHLFVAVPVRVGARAYVGRTLDLEATGWAAWLAVVICLTRDLKRA